MIKFFRKIRQKTLTENKFGKYLTYAIGEIILVVIGILIALQINTWNEETKNNAKASNYINRLIADISKDTTTINTKIKGSLTNENRYKNYLDFLKQGNIKLEQLKDSIDVFPKDYLKIDITKTTYNELISSGNFDVINEKKRIAIIEYYEFYENFINLINDQKSLILQEDVEASKYIDRQSFIKHSFYKSINYVPNEADIVQGLKHRHNAIETSYEIAVLFQGVGPIVIERGKKAITILRE